MVTPQLLITFLHLAEVDKLPKDSLNWVKQKVDTQTLYNAYSVTGKAEDKSTSAANYAIAMMIGNAVHDDQLYDAAKKFYYRCKLQIRNLKFTEVLEIVRLNRYIHLMN